MKTDNGSQIRQYKVALIVTISIFTCGLGYGWAGPSLPKLLSSEYPFEVSSDEASYIATISLLGSLIGGLPSSYAIDILGRKKTIILMTIPQIIAFTCIYFSYLGKQLLYIARFSGGLSEGTLYSLCALYISEISEPNIRGILASFASIFNICGMIFANVVGFYLSLYNAALIFIIFPVLFILLFIQMPETPYFYLMKKQTDEAETVLKYLLNKTDVNKNLAQLTHDVNRQMSERGSFKDLFIIKSNRKAFILATITRIFQQFTGCTSFTYYSQILLKKSTPSMSPVLSSSIMAIGQLISTSIAILLIDKYGRKSLLLAASAGCLIALVTEAIYFTLESYTDVDLLFLDLLPVVMITWFALSFGIGFASIVNILNSELFSATVKGKALCLLNVVYSASAFSSVKLFQFSSDYYGLPVPFWVFSAFTFCAILFIVFVLPETKGKSLEEIQQELKGNKRSVT